MTQTTTATTELRTIGLDLGDTRSTLCVMDPKGRVVSRDEISTTRAALKAKFGAMNRARIVLEACGQSNWIARLLESIGHEVYVANPRQLHLISKSVKKTDRNDAHLLARIGRADLGLLQPTHLRDQSSIEARTVLNARRNLVQIRTRLINSVRASAKGFGQKLKTCGSDNFATIATGGLSPELRSLIQPIQAAPECGVEHRPSNRREDRPRRDDLIGETCATGTALLGACGAPRFNRRSRTRSPRSRERGTGSAT